MEEIKVIDGEKFLVDKSTSTARIYKAKLHIATSPFSFMEVEVESEMEGIVKKNDWLLKHYETKQK